MSTLAIPPHALNINPAAITLAATAPLRQQLPVVTVLQSDVVS